MEFETGHIVNLEKEQSRTLLAKVNLENIHGPIYFIGIGGIGMSALARLLLAQGKQITGSDKQESEITKELTRLGAKVYIGHMAENVNEAKAIVVSTAIVADNPELDAARKKNLPIVHRSYVLDWLTSKAKLIAVSGTHGKTTTTGMVAQVLLDAGLDPSVVVGGTFNRIGSNAHYGKGIYFVAEADESDQTHANLKSEISVVTNIEADHLENYPGGIAEILNNMLSFINNSQNFTLLCTDDEGIRSILPQVKRKVITYGSEDKSPEANYTYKNLSVNGKPFAFDVFKSKTKLGTIEMTVPGDHNQVNAMAAVVIALELGVDFNKIANSLNQFLGVDRRFQIIGEHKGITIVDDYGHHPTEVRATLAACREFQKAKNIIGKSRTVALFQPHQPGRLRDFWQEFCNSFVEADLVLVADVYIARGKAIEGIDSKKFAQEVKNKNVVYLPGKTESIAVSAIPYLKIGDIVITIGAGDITTVGPKLLQLLKSS